MVQEVLGQCEAENGTKIDELLQAGARGHKRTWNMLKRIQVLEDGMVPAKEATYWKIEGQKRRIKRTKVFEAFEQFRDGKFHVAIKIVESCKKQSFARQRCPAQGRRRHHQRVQGHA